MFALTFWPCSDWQEVAGTIWIDRIDDPSFFFSFTDAFSLVPKYGYLQDSALTLHRARYSASLETTSNVLYLNRIFMPKTNTSSSLILASQVSVPYFLLPGGAFLVWYLIPSLSLRKHDFPPAQPSLGFFFLFMGLPFSRSHNHIQKPEGVFASSLSLVPWTSLLSNGSRHGRVLCSLCSVCR